MARIVTLGDRLEAMDMAIRFWAAETKSILRQRLVALGLDERRAAKRGQSRLRKQLVSKVSNTAVLVKDQYLIESLGSSLRRSGLEVEKVSFSFARHGIFLEIGVGKNRRKGSGNEAPKQWIVTILPRQIEELGYILGDAYADVVAGEIAVDIPGVYSTTITI